jgi:hypothetical protein
MEFLAADAACVLQGVKWNAVEVRKRLWSWLARLLLKLDEKRPASSDAGLFHCGWPG